MLSKTKSKMSHHATLYTHPTQSNLSGSHHISRKTPGTKEGKWLRIVYTVAGSYKNGGMGWELLVVELELSLSSKLEVLTVKYIIKLALDE